MFIDLQICLNEGRQYLNEGRLHLKSNAHKIELLAASRLYLLGLIHILLLEDVQSHPILLCSFLFDALLSNFFVQEEKFPTLEYPPPSTQILLKAHLYKEIYEIQNVKYKQYKVKGLSIHKG
jgi:hypothetical protein